MPAGRRSRPTSAGLAAAGLLALGVGAALWLHLRAGMRFPPPWPDEAHFLVPAWNLADDLTLRAPQLGAPEGIMWIPDGWYVALAPVLALAGPSLEAARWFAFSLTVLAAVLLVAAGIRLGASARLSAGVAAVWLVTPHVTLMANLARMEALLAVLTVLVLVLAAQGRWPAAAAVAVVGILVHPVALAVAVPLAGVALAGRVRVRPRGWEWAVVVAVAAAVMAEAAWMATRWSLVTDHIGFQLRLKESAAAGDGGLGSLPFAGLAVLAVAGGVVAAGTAGRHDRQARAAAALPFALAAGLALIRVVGVMQWYTVLSLELAGALLVLGAAAALPAVRHRLPTVQRLAGRPWLPAAGVVLAAGLVVAAASATATATVFGLRMGAADPGEWSGFARSATAALHRLDERQTAPTRLVFHSLSGFPAVLLDEDFEHLRVVADTPVTGSVRAGDLLAVTPGAAGEVPRLPAGVASSEPLIDVTSEGGAFRLLVHQVPRARQADRG